jgi:translation initiation factor 2B subunit (eIF-2B alpha/beta/delta family)
VPVYVASEVFKIDKRTLFGHVVELEKRDKEEVIRNTEFESIKNLDVVNQFFDLTPGSLIRGIICEEGVVVSDQIGHYWERIEKKLMEF